MPTSLERLPTISPGLSVQLAPTFWGTLFAGPGGWSLAIGEHLTIRWRDTRQTLVRLSNIRAVSVQPGMIWDSIRITTVDNELEFGGARRQNLKVFEDRLKDAVKAAARNDLLSLSAGVTSCATSLGRLLDEPYYISNRDIEAWLGELSDDDRDLLVRAQAALSHPFLQEIQLPHSIAKSIELLKDILFGDRKTLAARNRSWVSREIVAYGSFFDRVETTPLTAEQRIAAVTLEDRNLVIASAGSGKTSTLIGELAYVLKKGLFKPGEILVLAFAKKAATEIDQRIRERVGVADAGGQLVSARTFHSLGLELVTQGKDYKPTIAGIDGAGNAVDSRLFGELLDEIIGQDPEFAKEVTNLATLYPGPSANPLDFGTEREWTEFVRNTGEERGGRLGFVTLKGDIVKSHGERAIANWLFMSGVSYEYEKPYHIRTATRTHRQYHPDFYFPEIDTYLEHWALDGQGNPPPAWRDRYLESKAWKEALHAEHKSRLLSTTFAEFVSGKLFERLESELRRLGQKLKPRSSADITSMARQVAGDIDFKLISTFIRHAKSNEFSSKEILAKAAQSGDVGRALVFTRIAFRLLDAYNKRLRERDEIDFEDMILMAARLLDSGVLKHPFRLILVDEFQDISQARGRLLNSMLRQNPNCKMIAVGDDWQSIFRFSGSDIDLFTRFRSHFGATATCLLTETFRSNQGIANAAGHFVQKNPAQLRKSIRSRDPSASGVIVIRTVPTNDDYADACRQYLLEIMGNESVAKDQSSVFILSRYNRLLANLPDSWQSEIQRRLSIRKLTIHGAKGLQADYVIVIGLQRRSYSFPYELADDPVLQLVMPSAETHPHSEERRLMYVAMTRARHRVYLLGRSDFPSPFLAEISTDPTMASYIRFDSSEGEIDVTSEIAMRSTACPRCGNGQLRKRTGKHGPFLGCSSYPDCRYTRNLN